MRLCIYGKRQVVFTSKTLRQLLDILSWDTGYGLVLSVTYGTTTATKYYRKAREGLISLPGCRMIWLIST
jgi:hypothetical protein